MGKAYCGAAFFSAFAGLSAWAATPEDIAAAAKPSACADVTTAWVGLPNVRILSAKAALAAAGEPAACIITGAANERTGVDGRHYALGFELRLPDRWNGRFLHQVNGGNDGEIVAGNGQPQGDERRRGVKRARARLRRAQQRRGPYWREPRIRRLRPGRRRGLRPRPPGARRLRLFRRHDARADRQGDHRRLLRRQLRRAPT